MNITKKASIILTTAISALALTLVSVVLLLNNIAMKQNIRQAETKLHDELNKMPIFLENILKNRASAILNDKKIIDAYKAKDAELLYNSTFFRHQTIVNELKSHIVFHFKHPDGSTFLRVHAKEHATPKNESTKTMIYKAINRQKPVFGYDLKSYGIHYRYISPIYDNDKIIGYFEIGIGIEYVLKRLKLILDAESGVYVNKSAVENVCVKALAENGSNILINISSDGCSNMFTELNLEKSDYQLKFNNKNYFAKTGFVIKNFNNDEFAKLFVMFDITNELSYAKTHTITILFIMIIFLIVCFIILKYTLVNMVNSLEVKTEANKQIILEKNKILEIQKEGLEILNKNLESRIQDETKKRIQSEQILFEQKKFIDMGQMISAVAHQWRQPLNALGLYIQDIRDTQETEDGLTDEYLNDTENCCMKLITQMSETIDSFRRFFTPQSIPAPFCIVNSLIDVLRLTSAQLYALDILYNVIIEENTNAALYQDLNKIEDFRFNAYLVYGYEDEFKQAMLNIINNAKDSIVEKSETSKQFKKIITVKVFIDKDNITIRVEDSGTGINKDIINKIFDPYFTTKEEGRGTGIGLYMCRAVIENHMKGVVHAQNIENGAVIEIAVPRYNPDSSSLK